MILLIINGPNLNLLGQREQSVYGSESFENYLEKIKSEFPRIQFDYYQSNVEGEIINKIHELGFKVDGIIINAGAYTHTSVGIRDAIAAVPAKTTEVHISNTLKREDFRHKSLIGPVCRGCIMGFGLSSYKLAVYSYLINENQ